MIMCTDSQSNSRSHTTASLYSDDLRCILLVLLLLLFSAGSFAQWSESRSVAGPIVPSLKRPVLEARILPAEDRQQLFFPGMRFDLEVLVINTGTDRARNCWIKLQPDSPSLVVREQEIDVFSLDPGDTLRKKIPMQIRQNANPGLVSLTLFIEEANGFDMFPPRFLSLQVLEGPDIEVAVTDLAIRDQRGIGYFEQFEDVQLFFRVQNCANRTFSDVNAQIELHPGVFARQLNPNFAIGSLQPRESRDISATVSTGMMSENISLNVNLQYGETHFKQPMVLEFRKDYKNPEELLEDGCSQFFPALLQAEEQQNQVKVLEALPLQNNRFAVIVPIQNYFGRQDLDYAGSDAQAMIDLLTQQLGYSRENIWVMLNAFHNSLENLDSSTDLDALKRAWRRVRVPKELVFYFIGFGSTDSFNGDIYLLPTNFTTNVPQSRININAVYEVLQRWKAEYDFQKVTAIFNIHFNEFTTTGAKKDNEFSYVFIQQNIPGITSIIASSPMQRASFTEGEQISPLMKYMTRGLHGEADLNNDGRIYAYELYRYLADEFIGIPSYFWQSQNTFKVPLFFGQDVPLY